MAGRVFISDPTLTTVVLGVVPINGFADGEAIAVEKEGDDETISVGVDGDVARVKSPARVRRVTLRLFKGSPANQALRRLKSLATTAIPGGDQFPFVMKDFGEGMLHTSAQAWISSEPVPGLNGEAAVNEWEITCAFLSSTPIVA